MIHVVLILNEQARSSSELEQYVLTLRLVLWNIYEKSFQSILTNYGQHFVDKMVDICKTCEFGEVHLSSISSRARCVAATCLSLRQWIVFRPDDASKKRFSWFPDWISKGKICVNLCKARNILQTEHLKFSFQKSASMQLLVSFEDNTFTRRFSFHCNQFGLQSGAGVEIS